MNIPVLSTAINSWQFASQAFANESKNYRIKQQWKSFFGAFTCVSCADKWFETLQSPDFTLVTTHRPRLYLKPFRVYMSTRWNNKQKIKVIQDTYRFINSRGGIFNKVITGNEGLELLRFKLNDEMEGFLTLGYDERYRKEGELVLSFNCDQLDGKIVSVAFSIEEIEKNNWICRIGCVQGHGKNESYSSKIVQKQLFGLRPKSLAIFIIQELSKHLGFTAIYGAGDIIQAYRQKHFIHLPWKHNIQFDYNTFWNESGGELRKNDGWYAIPLNPVRREIKEIKSCKRALYARRYKMMDELSVKISESVGAIL